jgi:rhodanese-related sulfurtransferase
MILIDVRTPSEYAVGHYPNAINHELDLMMQGVFPNLPLDTEIQVYCRSGNRSEMAKQLLERAGFKNIKNIGGYAM